MGFEKGQKYVFKVRGTKRNGTSLYYAIDVNGAEQYVKAYEFQKRQPPTEVRCICKGMNDRGKPAFMQDIASLIDQLYKVGDIGDFRIKAQPGNRGFYEVVDENDFCFRLVGYGSEKFYNNQMVRCRITFINMVRVEMELAEGYRSVAIPFYDLSQLTDLDTTGKVSPRLLRGAFLSSAFAKTRKHYYEGSPLWVMSALRTVNDNLTVFVKKRSSYGMELLHSFIAICTNLMENSDYLAHASETESAQYQRELGEIIERAEDALKALELLNTGQEMDFIGRMFTKLQTSGYLKEPERTMRILVNIGASVGGSKQAEVIEHIFKAIGKLYQNKRFLHVFGKSFIEILDMFAKDFNTIQLKSGRVPDRKYMETVLKALAIRMLLADGDTESDFRVYQSMLYRVASMLRTDAEEVENLTFKAYEALFGSFRKTPDYTWDDVFSIDALCENLINTAPVLATQSPDTLAHIGSGARCTVSDHVLTLQPAISDLELHNVIPDGIFTAAKVRALLNCDVTFPEDACNMLSWQHMWNEVYHSLFFPAPDKSLPSKRRRMPEVGDEVLVRVIGPSQNSPLDYVCHIEEENYWGSGIINPTKQIVSYNVKTTPDSFRDRVTGKPYLLMARVERIDPNGNIIFSMRQGIAKFNLETLDTDEKNLVVVSRVDAHQYLCITRGGVTMFIPRDEHTPQLRLNDYLVADIISIFNDGNVQGRICGRAYETFDRTEAFENLICDYADGRLYDGSEDNNDVEAGRPEPAVMPDIYLREFILVSERKSMLQESIHVKYSYLALCRILAHILGDDPAEEYYRRRMEILVVLNDFKLLENLDEQAVSRLADSDTELQTLYPQIAAGIESIKIVNSLDLQGYDEYLWDRRSNGLTEKTRSLASMVLAYNMIPDAQSGNLKDSLRQDIYHLLGDINA